MPKEFEERRKFPRVVITSSAEVYTDGTTDFLGYAVLRNISLGGIGIEAMINLEVGKDYTFKFHLPTGEEIMTYAEVVWKHHTLEGGGILYGLKFVKIGWFDKLRLKRFIKKELKKAPPLK